MSTPEQRAEWGRLWRQVAHRVRRRWKADIDEYELCAKDRLNQTLHIADRWNATKAELAATRADVARLEGERTALAAEILQINAGLDRVAGNQEAIEMVVNGLKREKDAALALVGEMAKKLAALRKIGRTLIAHDWWAEPEQWGMIRDGVVVDDTMMTSGQFEGGMMVLRAEMPEDDSDIVAILSRAPADTAAPLRLTATEWDAMARSILSSQALAGIEGSYEAVAAALARADTKPMLVIDAPADAAGTAEGEGT